MEGPEFLTINREKGRTLLHSPMGYVYFLTDLVFTDIFVNTSLNACIIWGCIHSIDE